MRPLHKHILPGIVTALLLLLPLTGCQKSRPEREPDVPRKENSNNPSKEEEDNPDDKGDPVTYVVALATSIGETTGAEGVHDSHAVTVAGLGAYETGTKATVTITPKEGFRYDGAYFSYSTGYETSLLPTTEESALRDSVITFVVRGDIAITALVTPVGGGVDRPIEQRPYARNVLINEDYWREQNRKAWSDIYPLIKRPSYEEATQLLRVTEAFPTMRPTIKNDTIYSGETTVMSWRLYPEPGVLPEEAQTNKYLRRVAYALADEGGNIVEIYPPVIWDGYPGREGVRTVVVPTVPEGEYTEHVLLNLAGDPAWYDLPIIESFMFIFWLREEIVGIGNWPELCESLFPKYMPLDVMRQEDLFTSERVRTRHVLRRNSSEAPPIPRWHSPRYYDGENGTGELGGEFRVDYSTEDIMSTSINLVNGSNQYLKGEVVMVVRQKHWMDQNLDVYEEYERRIDPVQNKYYPYGPTWTPGDLNEWEVEIDRVKVVIEPNATRQRVVFSTPFKRKIGNKIRGYFNFYDMNGQDPILYWIPEGERKAYFMGQSNYRLLNHIEKSGIPMTEWFSCSYSHPSIGHTQAIDRIKEVYADYSELGNRIHLYGEM